MQIPAYRIHNVLKVYTKQLIQKKLSESLNQSDLAAQDNISVGERQQAVIDRVVGDILDKIIRHDPQDRTADESMKQRKNTFPTPVESQCRKANTFVYNIIDENNKKKTIRLSV
ncbi:DVU0524 family FlgM-associated protein [Desulfonema magnum]|uniref:Uncharacterized protein n=1 Tax=Desulfonema magnum TaxID=45655 RepID=A0A975GQV3_9BACT|nr:DVU0524 family FlgM-associated protein [Desulfonema magnum]QTA90267.1 Uncharacterized protein dnm_063280 [Desulfonema magnum]